MSSSQRLHALPELKNPMLAEERAPSHEILVERRCLGQTELKVKPGQVGTSNATKLENLGVLDYAHLRVPLPKDLTGSGIFQKGENRRWPEAYFLMRRSTDGFISATGMFKAAYPFAQVDEELQEKEYIKQLEGASSEEVAGNVWIDPKKALDLADEYGIKLWIAALLDPEPITHGTNDPKKNIRSPPTFHMKEAANIIGRTPERTPATARRATRGARLLREDSPTKNSKPTTRKIATPRKPRRARTTTASVDDNASTKEDSIREEDESKDGTAPASAPAPTSSTPDTVKVTVENTIVPSTNGTQEVHSTKLNIAMPASHPDLPLPETPEAMLAQARQMVAEAEKIPGVGLTTTGSNKRKLADLSFDATDELEAEATSRAAKRARPVEVELRKEKIRRRALTGIAATLAVGYVTLTLQTALQIWSG